MKPDYQKISSAFEAHIKNFFSGQMLSFEKWNAGIPQTLDILSRLRVVKINPKPNEEDKEWIYVSNGAWEFSHNNTQSLEFLILAPYETSRIAELMTMAVNYHRTEKLDFGHVFPIGEGWLENSDCDYFLVSLPYPFGPDFEICHISNNFHIRIAWLLPITKDEKEFYLSNNLEELEKKFEENAIDYSNPKRKSVVK
ncbi:MAG: suppressor of fused domain protein [Anaerolineales bacterium]